MNRSALREIIIKCLYQFFLYENSSIHIEPEEIIKEHIEIKQEFVDQCVTEIIKNKDELKSLANKYLRDWDINRLSKIDQAILLLGIYELTKTNTPSIVCINEAVELSKKYSDEKVTAMINATLDQIYHHEVLNER